MKRAKKKSKSSSKTKKQSLAYGYGALYEKKYLYFLGAILLLVLVVIVIKILPSFAKQQGVPPTNKLGCANSVIDDNSTMRNKLLTDELSNTFGITLKGDVGSGIERPLEIYNTMCKLKGYGEFFSNIRASGKKVNLTVIIGQGYSCLSGFTPPNGSRTNTIHMGWCPSTTLGKAGNRFVFVHEMGHVIVDRNNYGGVFGTYYRAHRERVTMPTFNCEKAVSRHLTTSHECFADIVGEFLVYKTYEHDYSINHYRGIDKSITPNFSSSSYKSLYNFAATYIFGGSSNGYFNPDEFGVKGGSSSSGGGSSKPPSGSKKPPSKNAYIATTNPCAYAKCGNGDYCWNATEKNGCTGDHIGQSNVLYYCKNGTVVTQTKCSNGCTVNPHGADYCATSSSGGSKSKPNPKKPPVNPTCLSKGGFCSSVQYCRWIGGSSVSATGCSSGQICCK